MDIIKLETYLRLRWFVKLRWLAIAGTIAIAVTFQYLFKVSFINIRLLIILLLMIFFNVIFGWLSKRLPLIYYKVRRNFFLTPSVLANLQIGLDIISLTFLWHYYGGIENLILFFFVFHMIIASILLSKFNSYLWAVLSSFLVISISSLEYTGVIDHHFVIYHLTGIQLWNNLYWNIIILSTFSFTLLCVVYMTSSISAHLKERNEEIIRLEKEISSQKLQDTEKKLYLSEKMAALGKLAAGMAHEINNPLTTILSYSECLEDEIKHDKNMEQDIKIIIGETIRIRDIVKKILNFARAGSRAEEEMVASINIEITETVNMIKRQMDFINITFKMELDKDIPPAKMSREHFRQIIINLLVNSAHAMEGKGMIIIESVYLKARKNLIVKFSDTGPGLDVKYINNIFDPFFTTKKQGEGTGLGLSVSYGLIKMYDGNITAENNSNGGASFTLTLKTLD